MRTTSSLRRRLGGTLLVASLAFIASSPAAWAVSRVTIP